MGRSPLARTRLRQRHRSRMSSVGDADEATDVLNGRSSAPRGHHAPELLQAAVGADEAGDRRCHPPLRARRAQHRQHVVAAPLAGERDTAPDAELHECRERFCFPRCRKRLSPGRSLRRYKASSSPTAAIAAVVALKWSTGPRWESPRRGERRSARSGNCETQRGVGPSLSLGCQR